MCFTDTSSFTADRYIPIFALTVVEIICTTPLATFALVMNIKQGVWPWVSWDYVHADFDFIPAIPSVIWKSDQTTRIDLETQKWVTATFGMIIFLFLGTTKEARKHYSRAFRRLGQLIRHRTTEVNNESDERSAIIHLLAQHFRLIFLSFRDDIPDYSLTETVGSLPTTIDIRRESEI